MNRPPKIEINDYGFRSVVKVPLGPLSTETLKELKKAGKVEIYDPLYPQGVWASIKGLPRKFIQIMNQWRKI